MGYYFQIAQSWQAVDTDLANEFRDKLGDLLQLLQPFDIRCAAAQPPHSSINISVLDARGYPLREVVIDSDDVFDLQPVKEVRVRPGTKK